MSDRTILLLLSDRSLRRRVVSALEAAGYSSRVVEAPETLVAEGPAPAALLVDGVWPEGGAHFACRKLRAGSWREVPIAWLGGPEDELAALAVGASIFLTLPLDADELIAHLGALCEGGPVFARLESGLGHWRAFELDEALDDLQAAAIAEPGSLLGSWGQYLSSAAQLQRGEQQMAAEELHALLDERPGFWRAHAQLSRLYRSAGFQAEADEHSRQARALNPALLEGADFEPSPLQGCALPVPKGEEIEIELDLDDEPVAAEETVALDESGSAVLPEDLDDGRPLVLLADDSELALAMITDHLEAAGYRVATAINGQQAIDMAKERRPDLVVLDGLMPGKNGFETCKALKSEVFAGDCPPVLILSAIYTKRKQVREAIEEYGADDLIAKSTNDAALIEAAARLCPPARA